MRKSLLYIITALACLVAVRAEAATVSLMWDPVAHSDLGGYKVYYGTRPGVYDVVMDAGSSSKFTLGNLVAGATYHVVVRSYTKAGLLSQPSNEVRFTVPIVVRTGRLTYDMKTGVWSELPADENGVSPVDGPGWTVLSGDFNNDAFADLFLYNQKTGAWYKATDNREGSYRFFGGFWAPGWTPYMLDLDGDKRSDVFLYNRTTGQWFQCRTVGEGDFSYQAYGNWAPRWEISVADFNGDKRSDLFLFNRGPASDPNIGSFFRVITEASGAFTYLPGDGRWATEWTITPGDFDGDGRSELFLHRGLGDWFKVDFVGHTSTYAYGAWAPGWSVLAGHFNDDKLEDLFLYSKATGEWYVANSLPGGAFGYVGGSWSPGWDVQTANLNGDAKTDLVLYNNKSGEWFEARAWGPYIFTYVGGQGDSSNTPLQVVR